MQFVIRYGAAAGFEDDALALARRLFAHFDEAIDSLALVPIDTPDLDLFLNGRLIHSYRKSGRAPRLTDVPGGEQRAAANADNRPCSHGDPTRDYQP